MHLRTNHVKQLLMFSLILTLFAVGNSGIAHADNVSYSSLVSAVNVSITNPVVASDILNNPLVSNYITSNPVVFDYFLNNSDAINTVLSDPAVVPVDANGVSLIYLLNNPSMGLILSNPMAFTNFTGTAPLSFITSTPALFGSLLDNPALITMVNNPAQLGALVSDPSFTPIISNQAAYASLLGNPALGGIIENSTPFTAFLSGASSTTLIDNPVAFSNLLGNPTLAGIVGMPGFQTFLSSPSVAALLGSQAFVTFIGNPSFSIFLNNSNLTSILANPAQITSALSNPSLASINSNPALTASLLSNPNLGGILGNQAGLSTVISSPSFAVVLNNPAVFSTLLSSGSLSTIVGNPAQLTTFLTYPSLNTMFTNPSMLAMLFSNPNFGIIVNNPAGLAAILTNAQLSGPLSDVNVFTGLLNNPSLGIIMLNPTGFINILTNSQMSSITSNPALLLGFINNPSFGSIVSNPVGFLSFIGSNSLSGIIGNPSALGSLLGNPSLGSIMGNPAGLGSLLGNPNIGLGNPGTLVSLLGNPSLGVVIGNPAGLSALLNDPSMATILGNPNLLNSLLGNPSLGGIIGNPVQLTSLLGNPGLTSIIGNPNLLGSLLGNPNLGIIAGNQGQLVSFLNIPSLGGILGNPSVFGSLLGNPSFSGILGNPTGLSSLLGGPAGSNLLGNPTSLASLLSNPSLGSLLSNPAGLTSLLTNPAMSNLLGTQGLNSMLSNPALKNFLNNPSLSSILSNPAALSSLIGNPALASFLGNPAIASLLGNPALGSLLNNPALSSLIGSQALGSFLSNPALSGLLGNTQLGSLFSSGIGGLPGSGGIGGLTGVTGLGGIGGLTGFLQCPSSSPWFGFCEFVSTTIDLTMYTGYAGNGQINQIPSITTQSPTPLIETVLNQNLQNGQWLITCPVSPNPQNSMLYFQSDKNSYIAGNRCLADLTPLETPITLFTTVIWTPVSLALGYNYYTLSNIASGWTKSVAYSGQTLNNKTATGIAGTTTTIVTTTSTVLPSGVCPNQNFNGQSTTLTFSQVVACAQNAGFSGDQLSVMVSIAYAESSFNPGATGAGLGGCSGPGAMGILQEGQCHSAGEAYPLKGYSPSSCSTYGGSTDWSGVYYNPTCAFQWAYAFVNTNPPITQSGCTQASPVGGVPYCFWGSYWVNGAYCRYAPNTYSGYACIQGLNQACFPWGNPSNTPCVPAKGGSGSGGSGGGAAGGSGNSGYNISNGYDTQSYIFDQVPASTQHGLWTWSAKYANLQQTNLQSLKLQKSFTGLQFMIPGLCIYTYTYSITSAIARINNTNVSIPQFNKTAFKNNQWLNVSGYLFSPVKTTGSSSSCYSQLLSGFACGGWTKVETNGSLDTGGTKYSGLNIYYGTGSASNPSAPYQQTLIAPYSGGFAVVNAVAFSYTNVTAVPYMLYNATMPSTYTQISGSPSFLQSSFDTYSTHNYVNPGNYLDEFSLYSGSALLGNYNGYLVEFPLNAVAFDNPNANSLSSPQQNFSTTLDVGNAKQINQLDNVFPSNPTTLGNTIYMGVRNPAFIAASPNGYIYVINYSTSCWFCSISTTTISLLFTFRLIPQGYYNLSVGRIRPLPYLLPNQNSKNAWTTQWQNYFSNIFYQQSHDLYMLGVDLLSYTNVFPLGLTLDKGGQLYRLVPLSVQPDDNGDLFFLGAHLGATSQGFRLAECNNGSCTNPTLVNMPVGFVPSDEFAASPGGQFVYVANVSPSIGSASFFSITPTLASSGFVRIYSTPQGGTGGSSDFAYTNSIPLSYSNSTYNMNIAAYLAAGGPFNDSQIAAAYKGNTANSFDTPWNHHPISITDSKGILYVVDNWTFAVGNQASSILMLRAFAENGSEIPLNPTLINDFVLSPNAVSTTVPGTVGGLPAGSVVPSFGWKPYGWPLSANISLPSGGTISYCAFDCTKGPYDINTSYPPIGPRVDQLGGHVGAGTNSISISSDFNGTLYLIAHAWSFQGGSIGGASCSNSAIDPPACTTCIDGLPVSLEPTGNGCIGGNTNPIVQPQKGLYTELVAMHPDIQNYTKISYADNSSYICYLNVTPSKDSPCAYSPQEAAVLSNLYPPLVGVPSQFSYVQSLGGPEQYLNLQNAVSSLFPTGINNNKYQSTASSESSGGLGNNNYNSLSTAAIPNGNINFNAIPNSYLKSDVNGIVLTPYNITVVLNQSWKTTGIIQLNPLIPCLPIIFAAPNVQTTYSYLKTQLVDKGKINTTIEGGDPYLQYIPYQTNYIQNLSDSGLIISPYIDYQLFTSRLLGEIYVNQTISPKTAGASSATSRTGLPVVINATRNLRYITNQFQQISAFGTSPAYIAQTSVQINTNPNKTIIGANCGGSCPSNYYYQNKYFTGKSNLTYNITSQAQFFQLFELFKKSNYLINLVLNLTREPSVIGYNRLVYTYVDRFNNTIYQPVDVDFANITQIAMNGTTAINSSNSNETAIRVYGNAAYTTYNGVHALPTGSNIYLYWNININYYNTTSSATGSNPLNYWKNALTCALAPNAVACKIANPLSTQTQKQPDGAQEAKQISYHIDTASGGGCPPQPKSLLQPIVYNCNLYGSNGLTSVRSNPNNPSAYQYCIPSFPNGTGLFTSQLGLMKIVQTDANGSFNYTFNACGVGQNRVIAYYWGTAAPEPLDVTQTWLGASGGDSEFTSMIDKTDILNNTQEFNYSDAPALQTEQFGIGTYTLSFGAISIFGLLATISIVVVIMLKGIGIKRGRAG